MNDGDWYLLSGRIMTQKEINKEINKIGTWRENKKDIIIGTLVVLLSCGIFYVGIKKFQKNNMYITIESKKIDKSKPSNNIYFYMSKAPMEKQR